jgi:[ribosomal protein S5]-alanine N-acetyltransferase
MVFPDRFETARLLLRPIAASDAAAIFEAYAQDAEVLRYLSFSPHRDMADTEAYITRCLATPAESGRTYVLIDSVAGGLLGAFDLRRPQPYRLDCGYVLARAAWGRGLMTEALSTVAGWAIRQDAIWRIGGVCDVDNRTSARVMEKAGMLQEGILRRWLVHPNLGPEPRDCFCYALAR